MCSSPSPHARTHTYIGMEVGMRIGICRRRADGNPSDGSEEAKHRTTTKPPLPPSNKVTDPDLSWIYYT